MKNLLDTNICIALLKGGDQKLSRRFRESPPADFTLCSVVKAELLYGARKSLRVDENLALLAALFRRFPSLPFDDRAADHYGTVRTAVERAGTPVGANDLLIGCIALVHDLAVVTRNAGEFRRIPGLRVEEW